MKKKNIEDLMKFLCDGEREFKENAEYALKENYGDSYLYHLGKSEAFEIVRYELNRLIENK